MLLAKKSDFTFSTYQKNLEKELSSFGLSVQMTEKPKAEQSRIQSAFLKANTKQHMFLVNVPSTITSKFLQAQTLKIKLEIDTEPCQGFTVESHAVLKPIPFWVRTLSLSSLFSGKMHVVLCRTWGTRVKGRDWYDMLWFIQKRIPLNLHFLEQKMRQTAHYSEPQRLTEQHFVSLLFGRIEALDINQAKAAFKAAANQIIFGV